MKVFLLISILLSAFNTTAKTHPSLLLNNETCIVDEESQAPCDPIDDEDNREDCKLGEIGCDFE